MSETRPETKPAAARTAKFVLASASLSRRALLENAGIDIDVVAPGLDERAIETELLASCAAPPDVARTLAARKAAAVSATALNSIVIGADQVLALDDQILSRPVSAADARRQLLLLRGRTHSLLSAVCTAWNGQILWTHMTQARLRMRQFSDAVVDRYLEENSEWERGGHSLYRVESPGIQLFAQIDGDYFAILGLPLLPLLAHLRDMDLVVQ